MSGADHTPSPGEAFYNSQLERVDALSAELAKHAADLSETALVAQTSHLSLFRRAVDEQLIEACEQYGMDLATYDRCLRTAGTLLQEVLDRYEHTKGRIDDVIQRTLSLRKSNRFGEFDVPVYLYDAKNNVIVARDAGDSSGCPSPPPGSRRLDLTRAPFRPAAGDTMPSAVALSAAATRLMDTERKDMLRRVPAQWRYIDAALAGNLTVVDNPGGGDCMYYAIAPMLRAVQPSLFSGVAEDPEAEMLRLRHIVALNVPPQDSDDYQLLLRNYDNDRGLSRAAPLYVRRYAGDRGALQKFLLTSSHEGTTSDFELLRDSAPNVAFILINYGYNRKSARRAARAASGALSEGVLQRAVTVQCQGTPATLVQDGSANATRFVIIPYYPGHYMRARATADGKFVWTQQELERDFPGLWAEYKSRCLPSAWRAAPGVVLNDLLERFPTLNAAIARLEREYPTRSARDKRLLRPPNMLNKYDWFAHGVLDIDVENHPSEALRRYPEFETYATTMTDAERQAFQDRLAVESIARLIEQQLIASGAERDVDDDDDDDDDEEPVVAAVVVSGKKRRRKTTTSSSPPTKPKTKPAKPTAASETIRTARRQDLYRRLARAEAAAFREQ